MKLRILTLIMLGGFCTTALASSRINRKAVVTRHNPEVSRMDALSALTLGNGGFAYTVDVTGMQTFPEAYTKGICLGTMSNWGWHSMPNPEGYTVGETVVNFDLGRGRQEPYSTMSKESRRQRKASSYFSSNPHRLHLGVIGFDIPLADTMAISDIHQHLDMYNGKIDSRFKYRNSRFHVETVCHPDRDLVAAHISGETPMAVVVRFPYPTGGHSDDACKWDADDKHQTEVVDQGLQYAIIRRTIDSTVYYVNVCWTGKASIVKDGENRLKLNPKSNDYTVTCEFKATPSFVNTLAFSRIAKLAARHWNHYWQQGAIIDCGDCLDARASELERRVVQSQYLMATQEAGNLPAQETGLTYNSWQGKFHLEMTWWHAAHWALWGHPELLARQMEWYLSMEDKARMIARRQGFEGVRWMKTTDPSGQETPSKIGSFLIWQQPHFIYFAELLYRAKPSKECLEKYYHLVQETAAFMYSFASYDPSQHRYVLKGYVPAQEVCEAEETLNSPLELSYWHFGLSVAQKWRERMGLSRNPDWDQMIGKLSPLATDAEGRYVAAENAPDTYLGEKFINDHPAVLGAVGMLPLCPLVKSENMKCTFNWIYDHWHWNSSWGWDYPMAAMNAARIGEPQKAVDVLLMKQQKNTYLPAGHNCQNESWRLYMPGNGGLLAAVAMMCAGWDGSLGQNPGFPKNEDWNIKWEGLLPLP